MRTSAHQCDFLNAFWYYRLLKNSWRNADIPIRLLHSGCPYEWFEYTAPDYTLFPELRYVYLNCFLPVWVHECMLSEFPVTHIHERQNRLTESLNWLTSQTTFTIRAALRCVFRRTQHGVVTATRMSNTKQIKGYALCLMQWSYR
jgi:hypothetical protein